MFKNLKQNKKREFKKSLKYALRGLLYVIRNERNFRIELIIASLVIIGAIILGLKSWEFIIVLLMISWVLVAELINTALERVVDILEPKVHPFARLIKDVMAAAVLFSSMMALIIGLVIFAPYIIDLTKYFLYG